MTREDLSAAALARCATRCRTCRALNGSGSPGFAFAGGLDDASLARPVDYRLLDGKPGASRPDHMVQHLVNHATYHRGQVATMLRQLGAAPPAPTDLIAFHRVRGDAR